jgi:hypothetical protein
LAIRDGVAGVSRAEDERRAATRSADRGETRFGRLDFASGLPLDVSATAPADDFFSSFATGFPSLARPTKNQAAPTTTTNDNTKPNFTSLRMS